MLRLVEVATFAIVMDMAVKQKASVTCRLGCVSARIIQRGTHATSARRDIMEILGGCVVRKGSYFAVIGTLFYVNCVNILFFVSLIILI
jgi:hypothetical protein